MKTDQLLSSLDKLRQTGTGGWIACCPAHDDSDPSLAIHEVDDRLLIHCFSGCSVYEIISAVGMELSDLFPESVESHVPVKPPFNPADVLKCLSLETLFVEICVRDLLRGQELNSNDYDRLCLAGKRIRMANE